ncbi:MAG TPA: M56 family metallopeptidase [Gammaproteobacteria bacterium]|nr:M56 family metallopeptidase [Gammaproteobacteria bacterium]
MDTQTAILAAGSLLAGILVKGALLLAAAALVTSCLRRRGSAAATHAVWGLTFLGLLLLPAAAAVGPDLDIPGWSHQTTPASTPATFTSPDISAPMLPETPATALSATTSASPTNDVLSAWPAALLLLWAVGGIILLARFGLGMMRVASLSRRARPVRDSAWNTIGSRIERQLGLRRHVALRWHADVEVPMTFGIFRPVVLLPGEIGDWPAEQRRLVLLHEFSHVRRYDVLTQVVMQLARALHWPNPLVWIGAHHFLLTREQACDDCVLTAGAQPSDYASQLVEIARHLKAGSSFAAAPAMAEPSELKSRIQSILDERRLRRRLSWPRACVMGLMTVALVMPLAALRPAAAQTDQADIAAEQRADMTERRQRPEEHQTTDPQVEIQKRAVFALSQLPPEQSVPRLIEIVNSHTKMAVRERAVFWLGQIGNPKATDFLKGLLKTDAPLELREKALFGISQLPREQSVPLLITIAKQGADPALREKAVFWLGQSHDPRAIEALMSIIQEQ